jgi:glycosyltransferase involved in cell wall biosynthesis
VLDQERKKKTIKSLANSSSGDLLVFSYIASSNQLNISSAKTLFESLREVTGANPATNYSINVYGNICNHLPDFRDVRVCKKGWIENPATIYKNSDIMLAPMTLSTGMNVKVLEAIDFHMPLIATQSASKGSQIRSEMANFSTVKDMSKAINGLISATQAQRSCLIDYLARKSSEASAANDATRAEFNKSLERVIIDWRQNRLAKGVHSSRSNTLCKVAIIIPAYNTEEYIESCLESVLQGGLEDIEIIVVDDGSTDKTYEKCLEISARDNRVKPLKLPANCGQAGARNLGLQVAQSEYIYFVDSDDTIKAGSVKHLFDSCIKENLDICFISRPQFLNNVTLSRMSCFGAWQAMIKRKLIERVPSIRQPNVRSGQDGLFSNMCLTRATRIGVNASADYYYNKREGSTFGRASQDLGRLPSLIHQQINALRSFYYANNLFQSQSERYLLFLHDETFCLRIKPCISKLEHSQLLHMKALLRCELLHHNAASVLAPYKDALESEFWELTA